MVGVVGLEQLHQSLLADGKTTRFDAQLPKFIRRTCGME